jgi:hypothetical protein
MLGAGAAFTFGAFTDLLNGHPWFDIVAYIATSILGLALMALLIAMIASNSLRDRS